MITIEDYFGRVSRPTPPSDAVKANAADLLARVNALLDEVNVIHPGIAAAMNPIVNSGWRPAAYNATVPGAAVNSKHITGQAIDLADPDGELDDLLFKFPNFLLRAELYLEHPASTKNWTHLQSLAPRSGNRVFFP